VRETLLNFGFSDEPLPNVLHKYGIKRLIYRKSLSGVLVSGIVFDQLNNAKAAGAQLLNDLKKLGQINSPRAMN
jgi:hypothetical protein